MDDVAFTAIVLDQKRLSKSQPYAKGRSVAGAVIFTTKKCPPEDMSKDLVVRLPLRPTSPCAKLSLAACGAVWHSWSSNRDISGEAKQKNQQECNNESTSDERKGH